ncbi:dihydropteroate synthase [Haladaptatus salinisoli]|uniref:dihydropteroate synthase n=1 Tax=Haladaptatus salinisoli TaxID=2884876 RepID=UPI001D0A3557|nr:dihydropteroate synthase [Haladaptatus salinisoli]
MIENAIACARETDKAGAEVIDMGVESSRPDAVPVSSEEELKRVIPISERISKILELVYAFPLVLNYRSGIQLTMITARTIEFFYIIGRQLLRHHCS